MSVHYECLKAVRDEIVGLHLPGILPSEIAIRKKPHSKDYVHPGITLYPEAPLEGAGTNERDDIGYPVRLLLVKSSGGDNFRYIEPQLLWVQKIRRHFNHKRLAGVPCVFTVTARVDEEFDTREFQGGRDVTAMLITCWARESRD